MNRVCAVVVTYNRKDLLERCINAVRSQTASVGGILVVNNGSTDGTGDWLDSQKISGPFTRATSEDLAVLIEVPLRL